MFFLNLTTTMYDCLTRVLTRDRKVSSTNENKGRKPFKRFQSQGQGHRNEHEHNDMPCISLSSCAVYMRSLTVVFLCRSTVALYHGQSTRNEHQHTCHAKCECHSVNTVRDIAFMVQVFKKVTFERQLIVTLSGEQSYRTDKRLLYSYLVGLS